MWLASDGLVRSGTGAEGDGVTPQLGRFLLVELEPDLAAHQNTRTGEWASIQIIPGVHSITDLSIYTAHELVEHVQSVLRPSVSKRRKTKAMV